MRPVATLVTSALLTSLLLAGNAFTALAQGAASQASVSPPDEQASGQACRYGAWSAPDTLAHGIDEALFYSSLAAGTGGAPYAVGNSAFQPWHLRSSWHRRSLPQPADSVFLRGYRLPGAHSLGSVPEGDFNFLFPRTVLDADGTLHLAWAEAPPDTASTGQKNGPLDFSFEANQVYYAAYQQGTAQQGQWSRPELLFESGRTLEWNSGREAGFVSDSSGALHLTFPDRPPTSFIQPPSDSGAFLVRPPSKSGVYLRKAPGGAWEDRSPELPRRARGTDVATGPEGRRTFLAYNTIYRTRFSGERIGGETGNVHVVRSDDGGRTWSEPVSVAPLETESVQDLKVLVDASGTVHLLWAKSKPKTPFSSKAIWHARSTDGGRTWTAAEAAALPDENERLVGSLEVALDPCGGLHAVALAVSPEIRGARLYYARWDGGSRWAPLQRLYDDLPGVSSYSRFAIGASGQMHLVWTQAADENGEGPGPDSDVSRVQVVTLHTTRSLRR